MAKSITVQRKILKLNSKDIRNYTEMFLLLNKNTDGHKNKTIKNIQWVYELDWKDKANKDSIITLGESTTLRLLDIILGKNVGIKDLYDEKRKAIREKRKGLNCENEEYENKSIRQIYDEIDDLQFQENYISVTFDKKEDFRLINKNGLMINGKNFKRLYGTSSGIKCNTVIYVCNDSITIGDKETTIHAELLKRLENGYNKEIKLVPSKYEAYISLNSSASTVVFSNFEPNEILVVPDQQYNVLTKATVIRECLDDKPNIDEDVDYNFTLEQSDGGGIIDKSVADIWSNNLKLDYTPSIFIVRNSFLKGTLGVMDIEKLKERYRDNYGDVYDVWNKNKPEELREKFDISNVKIIIPTSMLKLWKCYDGIEDYLSKCNENDHVFSVTKTSPKVLENERTLNYQFTQSLFLDDEDIIELTRDTVNIFHDILKNDFSKSILYSKGTNMNKVSVANSDNDFFKAMMIDERMLKDPHVRKTLYKMIKKSIDRAKISKIKVKANYQMIIPDLVSFFKHSFGMEDTTGILSEGEFYSEYWNNLGVEEVVAMRAPACTHANFRKLKFVKDKKDIGLFEHIKTAIVFNGYDSTAESLSGADKDGDSVFTTNNKIILKGVKLMNPIICPMEGSGSDEISENSLSESNLKGFNNNVGSATNKASAIRDKMFMFDSNSEEYKELFRREQAIQRIQQSIIDSVKNGKSEQIPSCWYDNNKNVIIDELYIEEFVKKYPNKKIPELDDEKTIENKLFNQRIVADKKPYYFSYIYPDIMNSIKKYEDNWKHNCIRLCGLTIDELKSKSHKTDREQLILDVYNKNYPVNNSNSVMNKICRIFEKEFDSYFTKKENKSEFDYNILKSNTTYDSRVINKIKKLESEYKNEVKQFFTNKRNGGEFEDSELARKRFIEKYKRLAIEYCENKYQLCDIVVDLTYGTNKNHQFAWDICGDVIIENLLKLNNNKIIYFQKDPSGTIEYGGETFTKRKMTFEFDLEE